MKTTRHWWERGYLRSDAIGKVLSNLNAERFARKLPPMAQLPMVAHEFRNWPTSRRRGACSDSPYSPLASAPALLERPEPEGAAGMVAVEGTGEIPGHGGGQTETERAKAGATGDRVRNRKPEA